MRAICDAILAAKGTAHPVDFHTPPTALPDGGVRCCLSRHPAAPLAISTWKRLTETIKSSASAQMRVSPDRCVFPDIPVFRAVCGRDARDSGGDV